MNLYLREQLYTYIYLIVEIYKQIYLNTQIYRNRKVGEENEEI